MVRFGTAMSGRREVEGVTGGRLDRDKDVNNGSKNHKENRKD